MTERKNKEIVDDSETPCQKREDRQHCNCWYDGHPCCACGDNGIGQPKQNPKGESDER